MPKWRPPARREERSYPYSWDLPSTGHRSIVTEPHQIELRCASCGELLRYFDDGKMTQDRLEGHVC